MAAKTLYKYLDVKGGLAMLEHHNLQFTNATRLNDPFDCHPALFDYSNTPKNKCNWPPAEFYKLKGESDTEKLRNSTWLCSLSKVHDSLLMWSYYGCHKGICIGLNIEKAQKYFSRITSGHFIGLVEMEVQYKDIIEKPDYFHDTLFELRYQLSTKAKAWEHEQEVRYLLIDPDRGEVLMRLWKKPKDENEGIDWRDLRAYPTIGGECFESLYLGINVDVEKKKEIIDVARKLNPEIEIYQMTIDPEAFRLKAEIIES